MSLSASCRVMETGPHAQDGAQRQRCAGVTEHHAATPRTGHMPLGAACSSLPSEGCGELWPPWYVAHTIKYHKKTFWGKVTFSFSLLPFLNYCSSWWEEFLCMSSTKILS